ncbi:MAG: GNAT family N-acetyltransferase [Roseiflexaceae bacterium]|nr:GNAT family N-acetyltransferase [Roseiflexus sp.]MDW8231350.1 GNAT family N-acetyltransferase [Roseiflexaceae bacterium]
MSTIHYRPIQASDANAVFAVAQEAWRFTYASIFDPAFIDQFVRRNYAPDHLRALVPLVDSNSLFFDVAVDAGQVVGFCNVGITPQGAQLFRIYLLPAYVGRGIGSELLRRGEEFVRGQGQGSYFCFVHKDNELGKRFYLRRGFIHRAELDQDAEWYMEKRLG